MPGSQPKDRRYLVGAGLVVLGLVICTLSYGGLSESYKIADKFFNWGFFTVFLGGIGMLYARYADWLRARVETHRKARSEERKRLTQERNDTRAFSEEIIALYTGFKSVRRELQLHGGFTPGAPLTLPEARFFEEFTRLNGFQERLEALDWRVQMIQPFLGGDQAAIAREIETCEEFTDAAVKDARDVIRNGDGTVTIEAKGKLFAFLQNNDGGNGADRPPAAVNTGFFLPMKRIRDMLRERVNTPPRPQT